MKVTFVFPGIAETGFSRVRGLPEYSWINHGIAALSACVKERGHEAGLLDLRNLTSWDDVEEELCRRDPDVLAITMMSVDFEPAMKTAAIARGCKPGIKIAVGGAHPSIMTEEVAREVNIDHVFTGEGEISFVRFLEDLEKGTHPPRVMRGEAPDLDKMPFIDRDIFGFKEETIDRYLPPPFVTLIAGRGCKYNCSFCQPAERRIFGPSVRRRGVPNIIDELKELRDKLDFQSLMFLDDCLTEDMKWVKEFCESYRNNGFRQPFVCQSRADIIVKNPETFRVMRRAGLDMLLIGFESGNDRILRLLRKGSTVQMNYRAAGICRKLGIRVWANYMLGMPTETREEVMDTVNMILKIKPYRVSPAFYTPHPGSDLYDYCVDNDLSLITSHSGFSRSPNEAKIRGIDYEFLREAVKMSKKRFLDVRLSRKIDFIRERRVKHAARRLVKSVANQY